MCGKAFPSPDFLIVYVPEHMPIKRPWFALPMLLLVTGVIAAGYVFWLIVNQHQGTTNTNVPVNAHNSTTKVSRCGNGVCENVVCLSTNCPRPEDSNNCPEDCPADTSTGSNEFSTNATNSSPSNQNRSSELKYFAISQSLEDKKVCPLEEANLTPAAAVQLAQLAGLTQGKQNLEVRLYQYGSPLNQCVWSVKNFETASGGKIYLIIDATQEVFQKNSWKE